MDEIDMHIVNKLLKMKLKSTMFQLKLEYISQIVAQNPQYLRLALTIFISRERPNNMSKDVDNLKILRHIFRSVSPRSSGVTAVSMDEQFFKDPGTHAAAKASRELAIVFRELMGTPDYAPIIKTVVRKVFLIQSRFIH